MRCPDCKAWGAASDEATFEVRGQVDGQPVRGCRNCGAELLVGRFGRARLIPAPVEGADEAHTEPPESSDPLQRATEWQQRLRNDEAEAVAKEMFLTTLEEYPDGYSPEIERALDLTVMHMTGAENDAGALAIAMRYLASTGVGVRMLEESVTDDGSTRWFSGAITQNAGELEADLTAADGYWPVAGATAAQFARGPTEERSLPDPSGINGFGIVACQQVSRVALRAIDVLEPPPRPWEQEELADIDRALIYGYGLAIAREFAPDS